MGEAGSSDGCPPSRHRPSRLRLSPLLPLGLVLVSLLVGVTLLPAVQALTWDAVFTRTYSGTTASDPHSINVVAMDDDNVLVGYYEPSSADYAIDKCSISGDTCTATAGFTAGNQGATNDLARVSESVAVTCWYDSTNTNPMFSKTTNGGTLWGSGTILTTVPASAGNFCGIDSLDGTTIVVSYHDATNGKVVFQQSTNGGATWGAVTDVQSNTVQGTRVAMQSASNFTVLYHTGSSLHACKTTTTGASFTCADLNFDTAGGSALDLQHVAGSTDSLVACAVDNAGTTIRFFRSDDFGGTWVGNTVATESSGSMQSCSVAADGDNAQVAWNRVGLQANGRFSQSLDGGGSWSAAETALDSGAAATDNRPVGSALTPGADFSVVAYGVDPNAGNTRHNVVAAIFASSVLAADAVTDPLPAGYSIVGWDVSEDGTAVVARLGHAAQPDDIQTWGAANLGAPLDAITLTNCDTGSDRVMAQGSFVGYINCNVAGDPDSIHFADYNNLGAYTRPEGCPACPASIGFTEDEWDDGVIDATGLDALRQIQRLEAFPISQSFNIDRTVGGQEQDVSYISFAFSTGEGNLGVAMFTHREGADDDHTLAFDVYSSTTPAQICTHAQDGLDRIAAVDTGANTKAWAISYSIDGTTAGLDGSLAATWSSSVLGNGLGVDCADDILIVHANPDLGSLHQVWTRDATDGSAVAGPVAINGWGGEDRTVTVSGDAQFVAYWQDGDVVVAHASNLTTICTVDASANVWLGMEFDEHAQSLWIATTSEISRYRVAGADRCGGMIPVVVTGPPATATPTPTGLFAGQAEALGAVFGTGSFGGGLFLGVVLMVGFAGVGFFGFGQSRIGLITGVIAGFLVAWAFGLIGLSVVFSVVVIGCVILGIRWFLRS